MVTLWLVIFTAKLAANLVSFFANAWVSKQDWFIRYRQKIVDKITAATMKEFEKDMREFVKEEEES